MVVRTSGLLKSVWVGIVSAPLKVKLSDRQDIHMNKIKWTQDTMRDLRILEQHYYEDNSSIPKRMLLPHPAGMLMYLFDLAESTGWTIIPPNVKSKTRYVNMPQYGWQKVEIVSQDKDSRSNNYGLWLVKNERGALFFVNELDLKLSPEGN